MATKSCYVSSLEPNIIPPNLKAGTSALKWPESTKKISVIAK